MKLVAGLGNPGKKYAGTRHNVGFLVLAELNRKLGASAPRKRFQGEVTEVQLAGQPALLLAPQTYMNLSGASVGAAVDFYKLSLDDVLIICDDWNLPLGKIRLRAKGSSGGQKGLADVIKRLASEEFTRLRIGIGQPPPQWDPSDFVLSRFSAEEQKTVDETIARAVDAVEIWAREGSAAAMNRHN